MALQLLRANAPRPRRPSASLPNVIVRRQRRALNKLVRAIRYGLSVPHTEPGRQARLLAEVFGPQLGEALKVVPQDPPNLRVVYGEA